MPLHLEPIDTKSAGGWVANGAATLQDCIADDPDTHDGDGSYMSTSLDGDSCVIGIAVGENPNELETHTIRVVRRVENPNLITPATLTVDLFCGAALIATMIDTAGDLTYTVLEQDLSEPEKEAITDYADLRLRFTSDTPGAQEHRITSARLVVPDRRAKVYSLD